MCKAASHSRHCQMSFIPSSFGLECCLGPRSASAVLRLLPRLTGSVAHVAPAWASALKRLQLTRALLQSCRFSRKDPMLVFNSVIGYWNVTTISVPAQRINGLRLIAVATRETRPANEDTNWQNVPVVCFSWMRIDGRIHAGYAFLFGAFNPLIAYQASSFDNESAVMTAE